MSKNVVWQSADGRVTSTIVAWPFSDFFQNSPKLLKTSKKRCLTVGRRSRDLRPLTRDRSATFFKIFPNCLKRSKNVVWQSADGRVTSTTVAWPFSDFYQNFPKSLETSKKRCLTVGRRSRDLRPLSRDRSATFIKIFPNRLKRPKTMFDNRPTVAWPPTTVAWPFSDFFKKFSNCTEGSRDSGRRSRDRRPTGKQRFLDVSSNLGKFRKKSLNGCATVVGGHATVDWLLNNVFGRFKQFGKILKKVAERSRDSDRKSRDHRPTVKQRFLDVSSN